MMDQIVLSSDSKSRVANGNLAVRLVASFAVGSLLLGTAHGQTLRQMVSAESGVEVVVSNNPRTGNASFMRVVGDSGISQSATRRSSATAGSSARSFLDQFGRAFGHSDSGSDLELSSESRTRGVSAEHTVKFKQRRNGVPIVGGEINVHLNGNLQVVSANGSLSSVPTEFRAGDTALAISNAIGVAAKNNPTVASKSLSASKPELVILNPALLGEDDNREYGAYKIVVTDTLGRLNYVVYVEASSGQVLLHYSDIKQTKNRTIHDQQNDDTLPLPSGIIVRTEGSGPSGIPDVDDAYDFSGDTYDFFFNEHGRDSLDDNGFPLISAVRYCQTGSGCPLANAFWNGSFMTYGEGFAVDDVVAHELAHGFTEFTSNLIYLNESGAINESFSDLWGEFVDLTNGADAAADRWLLGEDIPGIGAIRDMENPPAFGDPDRIGSSNYFCGAGDNGGVHTNSGVNNKAVSLMVDGGTFNGYTVTGIGISDTADVYYRAQTAYLTSGSTYSDLYNSLIASCADIFGGSSSQCTAVTDAILAVEMDKGNACVTGVPIQVDQCPAGEIAVSAFYDGFESGNLNNWVVNNLVGGATWNAGSTLPFSGVYNAHGENPSTVTSSALEMVAPIVIPPGALLSVNHLPNLEGTYDGGVIEYTTDGGSSWNDLIVSQPVQGQGYNAVMPTNFANPLGGREAFSGIGGYSPTQVDLSALSGQSVAIRFHIGTDNIVSAPGWSIDDVDIYQCMAPTVQQTCAGLPATVDLSQGQVPTSGNDVIVGTPLGETINGLGGDDVICGMGGSDILLGGAGSDTLYGGDGTGTDDSRNDLFGGTGDDFLYGSNMDDYLYGQSGADFLETNNTTGFLDFLWGGSGNDEMISNSASGSEMRGQGNNDIMTGSHSADTMRGDPGHDTMFGRNGNDDMGGGNGADTMYGGAGHDLMAGNNHRDVLLGQNGNDTLTGGLGNDALNGGGGNDSCDGQGQSGGAGDSATNCETATGIPFAGVRVGAAVLPRAQPLTEREVDLIERCDLTVEECLARKRK